MEFSSGVQNDGLSTWRQILSAGDQLFDSDNMLERVNFNCIFLYFCLPIIQLVTFLHDGAGLHGVMVTDLSPIKAKRSCGSLLTLSSRLSENRMAKLIRILIIQ
jgi:hypothetical protein